MASWVSGRPTWNVLHAFYSKMIRRETDIVALPTGQLPLIPDMASQARLHRRYVRGLRRRTHSISPSAPFKVVEKAFPSYIDIWISSSVISAGTDHVLRRKDCFSGFFQRTLAFQTYACDRDWKVVLVYLPVDLNLLCGSLRLAL
jgi:hypothetical protein